MRVFHARMILSGSDVSLEGDPVSGFDQKDIVRVRREEGAPVSTESEISDWVRVRAALLPDEKERRPGKIFPPQNRVAAQGAEAEVGIDERDWLRWAESMHIFRVQ